MARQFPPGMSERLQQVLVAVTESGFPGGSGWQRLPAWIPQERAVWTTSATWVVRRRHGAGHLSCSRRYVKLRSHYVI